MSPLAGVGTEDAELLAGDGDVNAREAGRHEIDFAGQLRELLDGSHEHGPGKVHSQHGLGVSVGLAVENDLVPRAREPDVDPAAAAEERGDLHGAGGLQTFDGVWVGSAVRLGARLLDVRAGREEGLKV